VTCDQAEPLKHAKPIYLVPDFHELAVIYAGDGDSCQGYMLTGCGVRPRRYHVTGVGVTTSQVHHHLIPFRDHVIHRHMKVRESAQNPGDPVLVFFPGVHVGKAGSWKTKSGA
jgi:hypothetical protein